MAVGLTLLLLSLSVRILLLQWHHGEQTGKGTYLYANGDVFKGKWELGKKHGRGIFTSGQSSWLETWEHGVRQEREACKFYPPRLLRTHKEDGVPLRSGADKERSIRTEIERLSSELAAIQRGEQWQQHVRSSAFTSLVSSDVAAILSPPHQAPGSNPAAAAAAGHIGALPSPAAAIEAAAALSPMDIAAASAAPSGASPAVSPCSGPMDAEAAALCEARPLSPLAACRPSSATADAAVPHAAAATGNDSTARCATPALMLPAAAAPGAATTAAASAAAAPSCCPTVSSRSSSPSNDDSLCKVCFIAEINTVLLPCAHVAVCMECSTQLQRCCICRRDIADAIQTYRA